MENKSSNWFDYIESLHPQTIELGLTRIKKIADRLNIHTFTCPVITVAGTNGKGSCVAFLENILIAAGYKTAAYSSPHLLAFNERIRIAGKTISDAALFNAFEQIEAARLNIPLTYFEFTTLAALWLFKAADSDILLLEVGLGGRLDAVNIISADIAIITNIALDHTDWLGPTRESIGYEKAGIFREGKIAICGDPNPPDSLLTTAKKLAVSLYRFKQEFDFYPLFDSTKGVDTTWTWQSKFTSSTQLPRPLLPLPSAAIALMAIDCLKPWLTKGISQSFIKKGIQSAFLPGRFQSITIDKPVQILLDVAHNPAAALYLANYIAQQLPPIAGITRAVVGILADKDISGILQPLLSKIQIWSVTSLSITRGSTAKSIANYLQNLGVNAYDIHLYESPVLAFQAMVSLSQPEDRIVVFGSFHTVSAILNYINYIGK